MKLLPITLAITLAMASTLALASHHGTPPADGAKPMPGMGMGMDHGMMGMMGMEKMSPEEHQKKMDEMFAKMDANSDGSVTKAEFTAHHTAMMAKHRAMMDGMHKQAPPADAPAATPEAEHKH
jgi:hypothetical protein